MRFAIEILFWLLILVVPLLTFVYSEQLRSRHDEAERRARDVEKSLWG